MAELLKDRYNKEFYNTFASAVSEVIASFDSHIFIKNIFTVPWSDMELKQRMWHTADCLHDVVSNDFKTANKIILKIVEVLKARDLYNLGLEFMFIPHYYEKYGIDNFDISFDAFEKITSLTSCEFAVRPFILNYPEKSIAAMQNWSEHVNKHVRRLATEGCRPRLPWSIALPDFKMNPSPIMPILWNLKNDTSEYVRRSVANNLNDISKDNPQVVIDICRQWKGQSKETDLLIKHAARTLLKAGDKEVLKIFGYDSRYIRLEEFNVLTKDVSLGMPLSFSAIVTNQSENDKLVRLEYAIYFKRKKSNHGKKVFKISEKTYKPFEAVKFDKSHSFRKITTRSYYPGKHFVSLIINGNESDKIAFSVL